MDLVPLGPVDPEILRRLQKALSRHLPFTIRVLPPKPLPPQTYHVVRDQYHSTGLLEYLLDNDDEDSYRILGVTAADLYIPIFTFVFGEAQLEGKAAVISLFRPSGAGAARVPRQTLIQRLTKLGLHELGHTFGLGHCRQPGCIMGFSENLAKLDLKDPELCSYCRVLLEDYLRNHPPT
ncbi:MAG: hypothetical protein K6T55_07740 [Syntrophobacterales bacterium]|nr:hypothetical protein [Syntrophobacterales bacterium]